MHRDHLKLACGALAGEAAYELSRLHSGLMVGRGGFHEVLNVVDELPGVGELREHVEAMDGVRKLHQLHRLPLPLQHGGVPPLPVLQRVEPSNHHHRRRELLRQLGLRTRLTGHMRRRVVPIGPLRQERLPGPIRAAHVHHRPHALQPQLCFRALLAAEVRLQQDDAGEADRVIRSNSGRGGPSVGHVVSDVAAGAVPGEEAAGEIDRDADVGREARGAKVAEHIRAVIVGCGVTVLGRASVVDGDDHGAQLAAEAATHGVQGRGRRGEQRKTATVTVHDDRERRRLGFTHGRGEDARPEVPGGVDNDVGGADAERVRARPRRGLAVDEREEEAVHGAVAALREVAGGPEREHLEPHRPRQHRRRRPRALGSRHQFLGSSTWPPPSRCPFSVVHTREIE
ncbi:unnamed protein product [Triticum aestivum]|uniref:Uncharacterized protein n=2 Tax=Triticum aestivum TaxID=4565 RepID=A0A9R1EQL0_WHEAT|nr:hypothetical protein CFC21_028478 [Triticum aestivum]SPT16701.1 unnamed protein product [Triticum aestivum]